MKLVLFVIASLLPSAPPAVTVTHNQPDPFTGRVFLLTSKTKTDEPTKPKWFNTEPFFAQDVKNWKANDPLTFDGKALAYPTAWDKLPAGKYFVQAVLDRDLGGQSPVTSVGNVYSLPSDMVVGGNDSAPVKLFADRVIAEKKFPETARIKLVEVDSKLLSDFHKKPMRLRAAVLLPKSYGEKSKQRYPVVYEIPGFGGDHRLIQAAEARDATNVAGTDMIWVMLDPACRLGHHVFADSANNGPYGQALTRELIPEIDRRFRTINTPAGRFVTGHSSGGWSSLWLQITHPDLFGGVWSTAPDPVDFRDFQAVNIYDPKQNLFELDGKDRPLGRKDGKVLFTYRTFSDLEDTLGRAGQLSSFEAVFGPKEKDGNPRRLWDRKTGVIDPATAESWKPYDIRLVLERDWAKLSPKLQGKIHVYMGDQDNFYLEGAVRYLKDTLTKLGSDAQIELFPGKDHFTLLDAKMRERIAQEMAKRFKEGQ